MLNTSTDIIGSEQQEGKRTVAGGGGSFSSIPAWEQQFITNHENPIFHEGRGTSEHRQASVAEGSWAGVQAGLSHT